MTEPKNGDRVRLTPKDGGETVIVGTVDNLTRGQLGEGQLFVSVVEESTSELIDSWFCEGNWNIEVIEPTTLDRVKALKPGAVIHNGKRYSAIAVKSHSNGDWYFFYSDGAMPCPVSEESLSEFIDDSTWEIKYEGHEVI